MNERACLGTLDRFYQGLELMVSPDKYIAEGGGGTALLFPGGAPKTIDTLFLETLWYTPDTEAVLAPFLLKLHPCIPLLPWWSWGTSDQAPSHANPTSHLRGTVRAIQIGVCDAEGHHRTISIQPKDAEALYFNDRGVLRILAGHFTGEPVLNNDDAPAFLRSLWAGDGADRPLFINQTTKGLLQAWYRDGHSVEIQAPNATPSVAHQRVA